MGISLVGIFRMLRPYNAESDNKPLARLMSATCQGCKSWKVDLITGLSQELVDEVEFVKEEFPYRDIVSKSYPS